MGFIKKNFDSRVCVLNCLIVLLVVSVVLFAGCVFPEGSSTEVISDNNSNEKLDLPNQNLLENTVESNKGQKHVENLSPSAIEITENQDLSEGQEILSLEGELVFIDNGLPSFEEGRESLVKEKEFVVSEQDCSGFSDQSMKNNCLYEQAVQNKDSLMCDGISDYIMQENCNIMANEIPTVQ